MVEFDFQETVQLTEGDYAAMHGLLGSAAWWKVAVFLGLGASMLLWPYTFLLGLLLVGFGVLLFLAPRLATYGIRSQYKSTTWLREPFTCGADSEGVWIRAAGFETRFVWNRIAGWKEEKGWFRVWGQGGGVAYFRSAALRTAGLDGIFRALANANLPKEGTKRGEIKPGYISRSDFPSVVSSFVKGAKPGAMMTLDRCAGPGFLQLATPSVTKRSTTIELGLPNADWVGVRWESLQSSLRAAGHELHLEAAPEGQGFETFLRVRIVGEKDDIVDPMVDLLERALDALGWRVAGSRYLLITALGNDSGEQRAS